MPKAKPSPSYAEMATQQIIGALRKARHMRERVIERRLEEELSNRLAEARRVARREADEWTSIMRWAGQEIDLLRKHVPLAAQPDEDDQLSFLERTSEGPEREQGA